MRLGGNMKKKRILAFGLSLLLGLTAIPFSVVAADESSSSSASTSVSANGMTVNKTVSEEEDGTYTISLEAFATGSTTITEETKDIPTDIVLVLDQSGSMSTRMNTYSFSEITGSDWWGNSYKRNSYLYSLRTNGGSNNLWYQLEDGSYVSVSVMRSSELSYTEITSYRNWSSSGNSTNLWNNRYNLYALVGGEYVNISVSYNNGTYIYTIGNQTVRSTGNNGRPDFSGVTDDGKIYLASATYSYTYSYTDTNGERQVITTSTGENTTVTDKVFYTRTATANGPTRLEALKSALEAFATSVQTKAAGADTKMGTADDVNHRIAVVGFASGDTVYNYSAYENTELLIGATEYTYGSSATSQYSNAFQDMNTSAGVSNVTASIGALAANGATRTNLGVEMATGILNANPVSEGEERNRVVIVFTDGIPGDRGYDADVASAAITAGSTLKNSGTTVYTVGIFDGADATSAGNGNGTEIQKANWFMQQLSSNNGTVQSPSYYLSASDAETLSNIFQQIANQIQTGGSSSTLDENSVVKDIISPQFSLPDGADVNAIQFSTYKYVGGNTDASTSWVLDNSKVEGVSASIGSTDASDSVTTNNVIDVTGFDFSENYVGYDKTTSGGDTTETARGYKLVITIPITVRKEFLGGNDVKTNTDAAIYATIDSEQAVIKFPQPKVDVGLAEISLTPGEVNVYLGESSENIDSYIIENSTIKLTTSAGGTVYLDTTKADDNWGLDDWMNAYCTITVDPEQTVQTFITEELMNLYTLTATIESGDQKHSAEGSEHAHVFKPTITYEDVYVYYGEDAPTTYTVVEEKWSHTHDTEEKDTDEGVIMSGTRPTLEYTYSIPSTAVDDDGKIAVTEDIPVKAMVAIVKEDSEGNKTTRDITEYTKFVHGDCDDEDCTWEKAKTSVANDPAFLLHVIYGQIKITKVDADTADSENVKYLPGATFTVTGSDGTKLTVTTGDDGTAVVEPLKTDAYTITETSAPSGYSLNEEEIEAAVIKLTDEDQRVVTRVVKNQKAYALPNSGSSGTYMFTIGGVTVFMTTLLLLLYKRQKERRA